ncbi:biotin/lipoyl-binding protein, partial [Teichococcus cervicalis]|uniref:biotin/lipoyl-binding protein n=1 Tax=Teichococcus cervicalis TaxID=204525 RepID=UPI001B7F96C4
MARRGWIWGVAALAVVTGAAWAGWRYFAAEPALPPFIVAVNGRIEAEQIDIASKIAGRVASLAIEEGQMLEAGAVVARLDASTQQAQLRAAAAQLAEAEQA